MVIFGSEQAMASILTIDRIKTYLENNLTHGDCWEIPL